MLQSFECATSRVMCQTVSQTLGVVISQRENNAIWHSFFTTILPQLWAFYDAKVMTALCLLFFMLFSMKMEITCKQKFGKLLCFYQKLSE